MMLTNKLSAAKVAVESAQKAVSQILATMPLSNVSNKIVSLLCEAADSIEHSINEHSSFETGLIYLSFAMTRICHAIKLLVRLEEHLAANAFNLSEVKNISGRVLCKSTIAYLKKAQTAAKTTKTFASMSKDDENPDKFEYIEIVSTLAELCLKEFTQPFKEDEKTKTMSELSDALKLTCAALKCSAAKVAFKYVSCTDNRVFDDAHKCYLSNLTK